MSGYAEFAAYVAEINDLLCTMNILTWDGRTQMPPGGAATRGEQLATLTRIAQERFTGATMGRLLDGAEAPAAVRRRSQYPTIRLASGAWAPSYFQ